MDIVNRKCRNCGGDLILEDWEIICGNYETYDEMTEDRDGETGLPCRNISWEYWCEEHSDCEPKRPVKVTVILPSGEKARHTFTENGDIETELNAFIGVYELDGIYEKLTFIWE